ncbi:hypothetical protein [Streptomyces sp. NPDC020951]|uniref:hypothetical protein n=1 Tax=Streptomyces sp. NPDC020951 TaxID=3365104 RepID=UPI0037A26E4E
MSYNLAPANAPWFEHLADSVDALGEAAREWKLAAAAAETAYEQADPLRRVLHDGKVTGRPGPNATGRHDRPYSRSPHNRAVFALQNLCLYARNRTRGEYEHAALLYASGAAWAIGQVRAGEQPAQVVFAVDGHDQARDLVPGDLDAGVGLFEADRYSKTSRLKAAYERLLDGLDARRTAEEIGDEEYVSEQDASLMFECWANAEHIADHAFAYGRLLQEALGFVLLAPREAHRKQLADASAAASAAEAAQSEGVAQ